MLKMQVCNKYYCINLEGKNKTGFQLPSTRSIKICLW